ncbi:fatty acid hydroxylase domain-containing protein, partial [Haematococcus lacustris]
MLTPPSEQQGAKAELDTSSTRKCKGAGGIGPNMSSKMHLDQVGGEASWQQVLFLSVGGLRGSLSLVLAQTIATLTKTSAQSSEEERREDRVKAEAAMYTAGFVIMTLVVNAPLSTVPSAFTGYSFHVLEAALVFANEVLVVWLLPLHLGLHRLYHLVTTIVHLGGHAGYEMAPFIPTLEGLVLLALRGWRAHSPELNTVQHHDMHHRYPFAHFSLYFTHWDRWCGTLHAKYEDTLFRYFGAANPASAPGVQSAGLRPNEADMARCSST